MKKAFIFLSVVVFSMTFLAACGDDEGQGYGESIKWQGYNDNESPTVNAGPEGGTFTFHCKNYSNVWLVSVKEKAKRVLTEYTILNDSTWSFSHCTTDWAEVQVSGPNVQAVVKPFEADTASTRSTAITDDSDKTRTLYIGLQNGNVFDEIKIIQNAE